VPLPGAQLASVIGCRDEQARLGLAENRDRTQCGASLFTEHRYGGTSLAHSKRFIVMSKKRYLTRLGELGSKLTAIWRSN